MNTSIICIVASSLLLARVGLCQPANDQFANRIPLTGDDLSFAGTLAGTTRESNPSEITPAALSWNPATKTVWWEWSPSQSGRAIIEIKAISGASPRLNGITVYQLENVYTGVEIAHRIIDAQFPHNFFDFHAEAGTNYQIQLSGTEDITCTIKLIATNLPHVIEHPLSQTISVGDSFVLGVIATGNKPFDHQWQRYGTNLPGETAALFCVNDAALNSGGEYRVIISNTNGQVISQTAHISVTPIDQAIALQAVSQLDDQFRFKLLGEPGRRYQIESSTNLIVWSEERVFPGYASPINPSTSVVSSQTGTNEFSILRSGSRKFYRCHAFHAANEECNAIRKQIRLGKQIFAYEFQQPFDVTPSYQQTAAYFKNQQIPQCPQGGTITLNSVLLDPYCSLHVEILEP